MKKAIEYRQHAEQCRVLARAIEGEHRRQLLQMAADWDALATERIAMIQRYPEITSAEPLPEVEPVLVSKTG